MLAKVDKAMTRTEELNSKRCSGATLGIALVLVRTPEYHDRMRLAGLAVLLSLLAACGARTGLQTSDAGLGARTVPSGAATDARTLPSDATTEAAPGCGSASTGAVQLLASAPGSSFFTDLALDKRFVYVADYYAHKLLRVPRCGGKPVVLATSAHGPSRVKRMGPWAFYVAPGANAGSGNEQPGSLWRVMADGSSPPQQIVTDIKYPLDLAAGGGRVYWTTYNGGTVESVAADGSDHRVLASGEAYTASVAVAGGVVAWAEIGSGKVHWSSGSSSFVIGQTYGASPASLTLDGPVVYAASWVTNPVSADAPCNIWRWAPLTSSEKQLGSGNGLAGLTIDGADLYFFVASSLRRMPKAGGRAETLATGLMTPTTMATDASYVFWVENRGLYRIPK